MPVALIIEVGPPASEKTQRDAEAHTPSSSIEDQVRECLDCIESGYHSDMEWLLINKLYKSLKSQKKPTERIENLIKMIEPVLKKYGYHEVASNG